MALPSSWTKRPSEHVVTIRRELAGQRNKIASYGLRSLIFRTPVKTGRARGGWTVGIGKRLYRDRGAGVHPEDRSQATALAGQALSEGLAVIAASKFSAYETIYISNNVPYIELLEGGYSVKQAPFGFLNIVANEIRVRYS